jgi:signal transduction histidine kinase
MIPRRADPKRTHRPVVPGWLLSAERSLRTHPAAVALASVGAIAVIALLKLDVQGGLSLALSYSIPVAFCAYSAGLTAAVVMSVAVSGLWVFDTTEVGIHLHELPSVFLVRLLMNLGVSALAALAGAAAQERERYFEGQRELERLRADLVSAFSHDVRSPLETIAGYAELLQADSDRPPSFDRAAAIKTILAEVYRLDKLVGEMLGAAQGDRATPLRISCFAPEALVTELRSELDHNRRSEQMALRWHVEPHVPELQTDRAKLVSIVRNLVNNALKYGRPGTVWVRFSYDTAADAYRIEVEDTGPGIAPQVLPHLFERFYRTPEAQHIDGFGLGLFIVKRFTELLHGSIKVDSEVGRGTRVVVTIPRVLVEPPPLPADAR